ncbi:fimbria/pilus outer membrane usher protein [Escherichia marmotae]|uniref:fimbria/pilus outer membrane usher protein n=1 Tax=Escherichia marmotae TaxID=1499973 RepID=UPI002001A6B8|nr:fimbria/pilus outer membrane usher protein [Escherichia marmotae]
MLKAYRYKILALFCLLINRSAFCHEDYFDTSLLVSDVIGNNIDLTAFMRKGGGLEGEQNVTIYVNNNYYSKTSLYFRNSDKGLLPDFPVSFLDGLLQSKYIPENSDGILTSSEFIKNVPHSEVLFRQDSARVDIQIPQAYLGNLTQLKSSPETWDDGVTAFLLDYNISGYHSNTDSISTETLYASTTFGANFGSWRLRSSGYYNNNQIKGRDMKSSRRIDTSIYDYRAERDIRSLRASLRLGQAYTGGMILDSIPFTGIKLYSNNDMLNARLQNYSPVVRGFANSQAVVTITQNGRNVYQTNVPAGPFELSDFSISGYSGDLMVTVRESDGSEHGFIQPFSKLPEMKREGVSDFELSVGRYDKNSSADYDDVPFIYGAWSQGFPYGVTFFGESVVAENYQSVGTGSSVSLGRLGAASADISVSRAEKNGELLTGQSYGIKYSKSQVETGSTITLAAYRYSTKDFWQLRDFASISNNKSNYRQKNSMSVSLSQSLGEYGSLSLNASQQNYWNNNITNRSASLSHSFNWENISFSTNFSIDKTLGNDNESYNKQLSLYVSVPFSKLVREHSGTLSFSSTKNNHSIRNSTSLSGTIPDTRLGYRVGGSWGNTQASSGHNASLTWDSDAVRSAVGYTSNGNAKTFDYSLSGAAVAYPGGIAYGRDSVTERGAIILNTGGISGIKHNRGGETLWPGTALISSPQLYTDNKVELKYDDLPDNIVLGNTSASSTPVKGAVTVLDFTVYRGSQVVFTIKRHDGSYPSFGTIVSLEDHNDKIENTGIIGENGRVYMPGIPEKGKLKMISSQGVCYADFNLEPHIINGGGIAEVETVCR